MSRKVLVIGPSGSGKSYFSSRLREQGVNAIDADLIEGLHGWYDGKGNPVSFPKDADKDFLDNHDFLWSRDYLSDYLDKQEKDVYIFGLSGNVFDMIDLFDDVYYLKVKPEVLEDRLTHDSRENPMGKTEYQRQVVIEYAEEMNKKTEELGLKMIDATLSPEEIYKLIK